MALFLLKHRPAGFIFNSGKEPRMEYAEQAMERDRHAGGSRFGHMNEAVGVEQLPVTLAVGQLESQASAVAERLIDIELRLFGASMDDRMLVRHAGGVGPATPIPPTDVRSTIDRTAQRLAQALMSADMISNRL